MKLKQPKRRNPVAANPLMRKGGVHLKSRSGLRHLGKLQTRREVADATSRPLLTDRSARSKFELATKGESYCFSPLVPPSEKSRFA